MSEKSPIEWVAGDDGTEGATWNPIRGTMGRWTCARVSPGCQFCYAATMNKRFSGLDYANVGQPLNDEARLDEKTLMAPLKWKRPRRIFVCSMTDLFGEWVPLEWIAQIVKVMERTPQHTYIVLTKRPRRMHEVVRFLLPNMWLGVTIESDQYTWRANVLRDTPAAVRWISAEPLLGPLPSLVLGGIDWVVAGGESGAGARPCRVGWIHEIICQCAKADVRVFVKQLGANPIGLMGDSLRLRDRKGGDMSEWDSPLHVREFPRAAGAVR